MSKCLVIIRCLPGHDPVPHAVIKKPLEMTEDKFVDSSEVLAKADSMIDSFKEYFVEFKQAQFYKSFVEETELW